MESNTLQSDQIFASKKQNNFTVFLLGLSLALGPVFWFPVFGKVLAIKIALVFLLVLTNIGFFYKKELLTIFFLIALVHLTRMKYGETFIYVFLNFDIKVLYAYLMFEYGRCFECNIDKLLKIVYYIVMTYLIVYLLAFYTHRIECLPEAYEIENTDGTYRLIPFEKCGWGFGGTQWATCLSIFVPLFIYVCKNNTFQHFFSIGLLMITQLYSGCRSGIMVSGFSFLLSTFFLTRDKLKILLSFLGIIAGFLIIINLKEYYKLNNEDITSYRLDQWIALPALLDSIALFGTEQFANNLLSQYDSMFYYSFHCSFVRIILGIGIIGVYINIIVFIIVKKTISVYQSDKRAYIACLVFCLLSSVLVAFSEPNPIIESLFWPAWWFFAGHICKISKQSRTKKEETGECKSNCLTVQEI